MTDEERKHADQVIEDVIERLKLRADQPFNASMRAGVVMGVSAGYAAAIEAKRTVTTSLSESAQDACDLAISLSDRLEAERARSAKLLNVLKQYAMAFGHVASGCLVHDADGDLVADNGQLAAKAIAEYEASK